MLMNRRLAVIIFALIGIQGCDGQTAGQVAALGALAQSGFEKRAADQPLTQAEQAAISEIKSHKQEARHVDLPLAAIPPLLIAAAQAFQTGGSGGAGSGSNSTGSGATPAPCIGTTVVSAGSNRTGPPILPREASSRDLAITDCQTEGQSVCGSDAPAATVPDFNCGQITLTLVGRGFAVTKKQGNNGNHNGQGDDHHDNGNHFGTSANQNNGNQNRNDDDDQHGNGNQGRNGNDRDDDNHRDEDRRILSHSEIGPAYTVPSVPGFTATTYLVEKARHVVLLDDTIALTPVPGATQSDTRLVVSIASKSVVDFMLAGEHTVTVVRPDGNWVKATVRFGKPTISSSLAPRITSARLIKTGDDPEDRDKWLIQLNGKHLPVNPRLWYVKIGNTRAFAHAGFAGEASGIGFVHLPTGLTPGNQTITLITPFGLAVGNVTL